MMKKLLLVMILLAGLVMIMPVSAKGGFDQYGYNYDARLFVGDVSGWCAQKNLASDCQGTNYTNDHLVMKWSKSWDDARFHGAVWTPEAWISNEYNGRSPGGSGEVWHYKMIWVGPTLETSQYWRDGGYPIWGEFEVIMDQGSNNEGHVWGTHAIPNGYGSYK